MLGVSKRKISGLVPVVEETAGLNEGVVRFNTLA